MGYDITLGLASKHDIDTLANKILSVRDISARPQEFNDRDEFLQRLVSDAKKILAKNEDFNSNVGFITGQYLGTFDTSWYLRDTSYSGLFQNEAVAQEMSSRIVTVNRYVSSWKDVLPSTILGKRFTDKLDYNYSVGCIVEFEKINTFLNDYKDISEFRATVNTYASHNIFVLLDALLTAHREQKYIIEATELVQPPPGNPGAQPEFYIYDLALCKADGAVLYKFISESQIGEVLGKNDVVEKAADDMLKYLQFYREELSKKHDYPLPELNQVV